MDIRLLPPNSTRLVDANILLYHIAGLSLDCKTFLQRVANEEVQAYLTSTIVAETLHRQMLIEAVTKRLVTPGKTLNKLKENPEVIKNLSDYFTEVQKLLQVPFWFLEVSLDDVEESHKLRRTYGMFVNDSINLACAQRRGISNIVTHDHDFDRVSTISVWTPTDVQGSQV